MTTIPSAPPQRPPAASPLRVATNVSLFLPEQYRQQTANLTLDVNRTEGTYWAPWRLADNRKWQHHVYAWAAQLVRERGLRSVLDVGCGPCVKLIEHLAPVAAEVVGIDQPSALAAARKCGATFELREVDLERPTIIPDRTFDLVLCADVIEHLADPDPALDLIRKFAGSDTIVMISTPERLRERGRDCMASNKPEHVREWSRDEFRRFLESRGMRPIAHRLLPKDDAPREPLREQERQWRLNQRTTSPLCCQAWACRIEPGSRSH
ncbi:MAG: class I SAM-dependent methyltransferase [Phycisphaerales bacterium]|nr:class I SAM-dependent methyltransferase [Phycisphaerales bacterium]